MRKLEDGSVLKPELSGRDLNRTVKTPLLGVLTMLAYIVVFLIVLGAVVVFGKGLSILLMG